MSLNVSKLSPQAVIPSRSTPGSAGFDLYSADNYVILPGHRVVVSTGVSLQFPSGNYGHITARPGLAVKHGLNILSDVVDADYTGEIKVVVQNTDQRQAFVVRPGYRIAQLVVVPFTQVQVDEIPGLVEDSSDVTFYKVTGV
jgi:dUTP pyrophosphatase